METVSGLPRKSEKAKTFTRADSFCSTLLDALTGTERQGENQRRTDGTGERKTVSADCMIFFFFYTESTKESTKSSQALKKKKNEVSKVMIQR